MDIKTSGISQNIVNTAISKHQKPVPVQAQEVHTQNIDEFVSSAGENKPVTYSKKPTLDELRAMEERRLTAFKEMLASMLAKQGEAYNAEILGMKLNVSIEDSQKAALTLEADGEYSVDAVATRILDMAKSLANGDPSKISALRDAVEKGFGEARKAFGKEMPSITNSTYDEIMKRFDEWEKGE